MRKGRNFISEHTVKLATREQKMSEAAVTAVRPRMT